MKEKLRKLEQRYQTSGQERKQEPDLPSPWCGGCDSHDDDASERLLTKALDRLRALEIRFQQKQGTQEQNHGIPRLEFAQQRRCGTPAQDASVTARSPQMPPLDEVAKERLVAALARSSDAPWANPGPRRSRPLSAPAIVTFRPL